MTVVQPHFGHQPQALFNAVKNDKCIIKVVQWSSIPIMKTWQC